MKSITENFSVDLEQKKLLFKAQESLFIRGGYVPEKSKPQAQKLAFYDQDFG
jgi:hypothetical protein